MAAMEVKQAATFVFHGWSIPKVENNKQMNRERLKQWVCAIVLTACAADAVLAMGPAALDEIRVEASRVDEDIYEVPAAIGVVDLDDIQLGQQQLGLDESLNKVPGVFFQNRYNFAQDLRVSIRGFGARAAFGIRGVKIFQDGIPSTLPDGQGGVDDIDLGSASRIELMRSPMSALYGSSAGGAISIYTEDGPATPFAEAAFAVGELGYQKAQFKAGGQQDALNYMLNVSHLEIDGYRDFSDNQVSLFNSKFRYDLSPTTQLTVIANAINSPKAQDPGGITLAAVKADRRQARDLNVKVDAGEEFNQQKLGFVFEHAVDDQHSFRVRNYYIWKDFENRLPLFPKGHQVQFDRLFYGGGADYTYTSRLFDRDNRLIVGFDADRQDDDRERWSDARAIAGSKFLDQNEKVTSVGVFVQNELALTEHVELTLGARYDDVKYEVSDHFLADGRDDSGDLSFNEITPRISLLWSPSRAANLYATYSTSFETPATTELRPSTPASAGFNRDLDAQTAKNYEVGIKGVLPQASYSVALYHIDVDDELVPREDVAGWEYFVNAGKSSRDGLEAALSLTPDAIPGLKVSLAYTYSDLEYDKFVDSANNDYAHNRLPGVPEHQLFMEVSYFHDSGWYAIGDILHVGELYADDANQVEVDAYEVANIRAGYLGQFGDWEVSPYVGVNNLFDEEYFSNVRINAFGGRYYEPAPERNLYAGIRFRYNFDH